MARNQCVCERACFPFEGVYVYVCVRVCKRTQTIYRLLSLACALFVSHCLTRALTHTHTQNASTGLADEGATAEPRNAIEGDEVGAITKSASPCGELPVIEEGGRGERRDEQGDIGPGDDGGGTGPGDDVADDAVGEEGRGDGKGEKEREEEEEEKEDLGELAVDST